MAVILGVLSLTAGSSIVAGQDVAPADPPRTGGAYWFGRYGCSACHGGDGLGSLIGPAIVGRADTPFSYQRIERQVRSPVEFMPDFPPERLSDEQLAAIIERIWQLEPAR